MIITPNPALPRNEFDEPILDMTEPQGEENRIAWCCANLTGFAEAYHRVQAVRAHEAQNRAEMMEKGAI